MTPVLLLSTLLLPTMGTQTVPQVTREWVIKEIEPPPPTHSGEEAAWWAAFPMTDVDGDGAVETYWTGESRSGVFPNGRHTGYRVGFVTGFPHGAKELLRNRTAIDTNINISYPNKAFLKRPGGITLAIADHARYGISFHDLNTRQLLGTSSGPGQEGLGYRRAGDQNYDGFEDLFVWSSWNNLKWEYLVDGRTHQVAWERSNPSGSFPFYNNPPSEGAPSADINLDGLPDLLMFYWGDAIHPAGEHRLTALRGYDGAAIWQHVCPQSSGGSESSTGLDWTGDGYPDICLRIAGDHYEGVSGIDGALLWTLPQSALQQFVPPGYSNVFPGSPLWLSRSSLAQSKVEICVAVQAYYSGSFRTGLVIAHLDPVTASVFEIIPVPQDQSPWYPDDLNPYLPGIPSVMGDIDRDGIKEFGLPATMPDSPVISELVPFRYAILALKTWFVAEEAHLGEALIGSISIPSAPNHRFNLLLSTGFDRDGGERLGAWKTHLVADALFTNTLTQQPYSGRLDAHGQGTVGFSIPNHPNLIGQTISSKVQILKPGAGQEVWTLSTLGQTRIVP